MSRWCLIAKARANYQWHFDATREVIALHMWRDTTLSQLLSIAYPIIQAPMAGGATGPELVGAVSQAGGLGSFGFGYSSSDQIARGIRDVRELTDKPFAVNLFAPQAAVTDDLQVQKAIGHLHSYHVQLNIDDPQIPQLHDLYQEQIDVVIGERVPVFTFTFGLLPERDMQRMHDEGIIVGGTATNVREALMLQEVGVDFIIAQGSEAGGHRGTFAADWKKSMIGTMALVPQITSRVRVPVVAAGGIMDGRGIAASLALGASGVQMGTAFLTCPESKAAPIYKEAILASTDESTVIMTAFSGKPARGIKNLFASELEPHADDLPPYPIQNELTKAMRREATKQSRSEFMSLWAGQASSLSAVKPAAQLVADLTQEVGNIIARLE